MGIKPSFDAVSALAALPGVQRKSLTRFEADFSNRCESPVDVALWARPSQKIVMPIAALPIATQMQFDRHQQEEALPAADFNWSQGMNHPIGVDMQVRCRKCGPCLRTRALLWAHKAQEEIRTWPRTWFATFTATPHQHFVWDSLAMKDRIARSLESNAGSEVERFTDRCAAAGPDITRYWKRVRKQSGGQLRYFMVAERHLSGGDNHGLPHWHALIHEVDNSKPIRKAVLKGQWPYGFTTFKLVENPGAAWYLCKYLSKDIGTRVRASLRYGHIQS